MSDEAEQTIPGYAMLDVWTALVSPGLSQGGEFEAFYAEHGYAETWARLLDEIRRVQAESDRLETDRDAARAVIERVRDWLGPESFWDDEADAPVYADLAEILDAAPAVPPTGSGTAMTETNYTALVRVLRQYAFEAGRTFVVSTDKKTLESAADAIETLVGEADRHGAEAFRLARDLREARNELARLNGQTYEIIDKAAIWDQGAQAREDNRDLPLWDVLAANPYRLRKRAE